jgi:hypothetical protein
LVPSAGRTGADSSDTPSAWRTAPLFAKLVFLLGVFFTFAGIGVAIDVVNLGHGPLPRFALSVALMGLFAVGYAASGVILRGKFLMALFPLVILHFFCMGWLVDRFPDKPQGGAWNAADSSSRLHSDGWGIVASIILGYAGFVVSSVSETRRNIKIQTEKVRLESEMAAARVVQQLLVPAEIPAIPGFRIESVYKPAGQVGGDFFQILPVKGKGVLVAIGDVSGKGMPAAMTVSLLVGTLRTLAHYTQSPGEILAAMNERMLVRSSGGFTTCLVLRADENGKLTIANAGHIAPYLAGKELPLDNGLPLGLAAESAYRESTFQLAPESQLTLLTDGVVEARDKAGVLFGFERSAALSTQPAEAIASAAQAFGQDDDITALTLSYAGLSAPDRCPCIE